MHRSHTAAIESGLLRALMTIVRIAGFIKLGIELDATSDTVATKVSAA
jgi:Flp pilus assembly pilin Flp